MEVTDDSVIYVDGVDVKLQRGDILALERGQSYDKKLTMGLDHEAPNMWFVADCGVVKVYVNEEEVSEYPGFTLIIVTLLSVTLITIASRVTK